MAVTVARGRRAHHWELPYEGNPEGVPPSWRVQLRYVLEERDVTADTPEPLTWQGW